MRRSHIVPSASTTSGLDVVLGVPYLTALCPLALVETSAMVAMTRSPVGGNIRLPCRGWLSCMQITPGSTRA